MKDPGESNKGTATDPRSRCHGKRKCYCWKGAMWHEAKGGRRAMRVQLHKFEGIRA